MMLFLFKPYLQYTIYSVLFVLRACKKQRKLPQNSWTIKSRLGTVPALGTFRLI
jgi:hypothetical protein